MQWRDYLEKSGIQNKADLQVVSIHVKDITRSEGKRTNGATLEDFYKCSHADLSVFNFIFPGIY